MKKSKQKTGTKELAPHSVNCCTGCSNGCLYCYGRHSALRFKRIEKGEDWTTETIRQKDVEAKYKLFDGPVMFPTTHDITLGNLDACIVVLRKLLVAGNQVLIVSKPRLWIITKLCKLFQDYKKQILFRFTIGVCEIKRSRFWEPGASEFLERYDSLVLAYKAGFKTSVSMEPHLQPWYARSMVWFVEDVVTDTIWIGAANKLRARTAWKLPSDHPEILRLEEWQTPERMREIYEQLKDYPKIRWKDSYKQALGLK